jgi:hypothetical protein
VQRLALFASLFGTQVRELKQTRIVAFGFIDFPLVSYHLEKHTIVATGPILALYSVAMAVETGNALMGGSTTFQ